MGIFYLFLAYKVLKRKRDYASITLCAFYVIMSIGLILNVIYLLVTVTKLEIILYLLYFSSSFSITYSLIFILVFLNIILKEDFSNKKYFIIIFSYAIGCILIHLFPEGITFSENWTPIYSWTFLIVVYIFFTCVITVPIIIYSIQLYRRFLAQNLKEKLRMLLLGITGVILSLYGAILFNTWQEPIFKFIYSIFAIFLLISSGLLIYYGIGRTL